MPNLFIQKTRNLLASFSPLQLLGIFSLTFLFLILLLVGVNKLHRSLLVAIPSYGGTIREGIIGSPRFINPLLAVSQSDSDMTALVYSGLVREESLGVFVPDLAESFSESEDGLTYTFTLRKSAVFHDEKPVTADDVVYTIALVQDEVLKSPKKIEWEGVKVTKIDDTNVSFTLKNPYPDFLRVASMGILPKHIWADIPVNYVTLSEYNLSPVGSGPYEIKNIEKVSGVPKVFTLRAFKEYTLGEPYITNVFINIYPSTEEVLKDLNNRKITQLAALPANKAVAFQDSSDLSTLTEPLPRIFGLFYNQSKNQDLLSPAVRKALTQSIDKQAIISESLYGYGVPKSSPLPINRLAGLIEESTASTEQILADLGKAGWTKNTDTGILEKSNGKQTTPLSLTISTIGSIPELEKTANLVKKDWERLGIQVTIQFFELGDLNQRVIKNRDYEVLLYGTVVQSDADLYAFWHSSQRTSPGLNVSLYANTKVDIALTNLRQYLSPESRENNYLSIQKEISTDMPATFLYSPDFVYITDKKISGINISDIIHPEDRFRNVSDWYIQKEYIWKGLDKVELFSRMQHYIQ